MRVQRSLSTQAETPMALTIGNFDGIHLGHQAMLTRLKKAAKQLNLITCVMTFEPHPREFFTPNQAPSRLTSLREKLELLTKLNIDRTIVYRFNHNFSQISPEIFISQILVKTLSVRWMLIGDDFRFGAKRAGDIAMLKTFASKHNFEIEEMPNFAINNQRVSSTGVRNALTVGDLNSVHQMLGRPYSISGRIIHGAKLGKKLGFPTANVHMRHNRIPLSGIFVVEVKGAIASTPAKIIPGVASLGVRPAVYTNGKPTLEVHLLDFNQEIYDRHIQVNFLHKLRDEEMFPNLEALTTQIKQDVENTRNYFLTSSPQFTID